MVTVGPVCQVSMPVAYTVCMCQSPGKYLPVCCEGHVQSQRSITNQSPLVIESLGCDAHIPVDTPKGELL